MKKVVITYNTSWYIYNFRKELIELLQSNGYQIITIAPVDYSTEKLKKLGCIHYHYPVNRKGSNILEEIRTFISLLILYKKINPDVVLQFTVKPVLYGSLISRILKLRVINNITGLGTLFTHLNWLTRISKYIYIISQKKANKVFFQNPHDLDLFVNELKLIKTDQADLLPGSGVNLSKFYPMVKLKKSSNFIFLLIARLIWDKGIGEYVKASEILKNKNYDFECRLLGPYDFDSVSGISAKLIKSWEDRKLIKYLGSSNDVRKHIRDADCIVLPSFYREGTSRSLLESAAMGKPLITTDHPGCRCLVDVGINGYLCKIKSKNDLADKMELMMQLSHQQLKDMGKKSRIKVEKEYDINVVLNKYLQAIKEII